MSLLWPGFLYSLVLIPLAVAVYIWFLRRRRRFASVIRVSRWSAKRRRSSPGCAGTSRSSSSCLALASLGVCTVAARCDSDCPFQ